MKKHPAFLLLFAAFTVFQFACSSTPKIDFSEQLIGRWNIIGGTRNGQPANTFEDAYFEFSPDGKVLFNLDGIPQNGAYQLDADKLAVTGTTMDSEYTITSKEDANAIDLKGQIRGFEFVFNLTKAQ
jgi:hypothetical protein